MVGPVPKAADLRARCPHCSYVVHFDPHHIASFDAEHEAIELSVYTCPACQRLIVLLATGKIKYQSQTSYFSRTSEHAVWPPYATRPVPPEVPSSIAADYQEAAAVLDASPKASAALSRRCLQALLRDQGFSQSKLWQQIKAAHPGLPPYIRDNIDAIRHIGNFAAHPEKDDATAEIIDVEPGESEWLLDVLDQLFEFYYVAPAKALSNRAALNAKLQAAGKQPMK